MSILTVGGLTKYYNPVFIFGDISFQVAHGDKVALVGPNGAGKSTLLKIIAGVETPTRGSVSVARGVQIAYLAQETRAPTDCTLREAMYAGLYELGAIQTEMAALELALAECSHPDWERRLERYGELSERFTHAGGYAVEHRIAQMLTGLGFVEAQYELPVAQLSGGEQTRAALGAALIADPALLLLDEPTNHLDLNAIEWLEAFLAAWDGTLMVVSHDRTFLNRVTNRTLEIAFGRLDGDYPAAYDGYLELKEARLTRQLTVSQQQDVFIGKTEEYIRRYKNSSRNAQAIGRERRLKRFIEGYYGPGNIFIEPRVEAPEQQRTLRIGLDRPQRSGERVLLLEQLVVGYDQASPLVRCPELVVHRGDRVAIVGPNGSGKTTLLKTLVGLITPLGGVVSIGYGVQHTYIRQTQEQHDDQHTLIETIRQSDQLLSEQEIRSLLGSFLFRGDDVYKRVGALSGGERSRLELARLTMLRGNLLVLDEPTNHLDIPSREALEVALEAYDGTLLVVSHDRAFVDAVATTRWILRDGTVEVAVLQGSRL